MKVKEYREEKGYTQKRIAEILGISQQAYSKKEKGLRGFTVEELLILEEVLEASISELFKEIKEKINKNIN